MEWIGLLAAFFFGIVCCGGVCIILFKRKQKQTISSLQAMVAAASNGQLKVSGYQESQMSSLENDLFNYLSKTVVTTEDLTIQKQAIQTLISDISHQCTTPIANIMLYSQLLEEKDQQAQAEIKMISQQTEKLDFLIKSLVKMSRLENGTIVPIVKRQSLAPLLSALTEQFQTRLLEKGLNIDGAGLDNENAIFDLKWTSEVLANILDNAIKYSPCGSAIQFNVENSQMFTKIVVKDEGIGVSAHEHNKIFQRFYRSDKVADQAGIGVGLYLARQIIEAQGGFIKLDSVIGKGSSFSIYLPTE